MNNFKKYLPSKKFASILLIIVIFIALFFIIKGVVSLFKNNKSTKGNGGLVQVTTIGDKMQIDSNSNGIPDFEEYLWGLDPYKNGPENKEFIISKRKALTESGDIIPDDSKSITDNDILARQFLATIVSLQQTGELNEETMSSVSEALGKNIEAVPIADIYTSNMLTTQNDSLVANNAYSKSLSNLVNKYADADIGSELTFIIQGLGNKDPQALYAATTVALAYQSFGRDLIKISVPKSLASTHLSMANNYEKTGQSIKGLAQMLSDPMAGMRAIVNYKKYSDALVSDLEKISETLQ